MTDVVHNRSANDLHWRFVGYFFVVHILGMLGIGYAILYPHLPTILIAIGYFYLTHLAITCGAHRLYAHESYKAAQSLQWAYALLFAGVAQGPIFWWSPKHKHHHAREDKAGDPHSPKVDGFFYSHIGWLLVKKGWEPAPTQYHRHLLFGNGKKYAPVLWQKRYYGYLVVPMTLGVPLVAGWIFGDALGGLMVGGFARLMLQYHFTWIVNSVGHRELDRKGGHSSNFWWGWFLTVGESFHRNHHDSPGDYRLGIKWWEFDPGKWLLQALSLTPLVSDLRIPKRRRTA